MRVGRYRKRPVVIEAVQLDQMNAAEVASWCGGDMDRFMRLTEDHDVWLGVAINTLEGEVLASPGDWVIRGVEGEFYPCKPIVFDQIYDEVP